MRGSSTTVPHRRARPRLVGAALAVAALALLPYAVARVLLSDPQIQARARARVVEAIRARVGGAVAVEGDLTVDPLLRLAFGPLVIEDPAPGFVARLHVERVKARARLTALLAGRVEPASVALAGARVVLAPPRGGDGAPGGTAGRHTPPADRARPPAAPEPLRVSFRRLVVEVATHGPALELGPFDGELTRARDAGGERLALDLRLPGAGRAVLEARRAPGQGWRGTARATRLGPALLPAALRGGVAELAGGAVSITAEGTAAPGLATAEARVRAGAQGIVLAGERVGPAPMGPFEAAGAATLRWDARARRLSLSGGRISLPGAVELEVDGALGLVAGDPFLLSVRADGLAFAPAVAALPPALAPPAAVPLPAGTLDAHLRLSGPLRAPGEWTLSAALDLSRMRAAARAAPPVALRAPFTHRWTAQGRALAVEVGPSNPDFVPLADLPVHVVRAVTTSEDGGFFGHAGFDFGELRNALAEDAAAGRAVRGGSTITQQLAKNLYLGGEKTLARKVREAVITVALEATVPKQRLLEIYLNIVEWGPGVRGIGPAARHWFGKDARALTPAEAAFLASIIPSPTRYHFMHDRGGMSEAWRRRVDDVLLKMTEQGVLGSEDLARALAEPVVFTHG